MDQFFGGGYFGGPDLIARLRDLTGFTHAINRHYVVESLLKHIGGLGDCSQLGNLTSVFINYDNLVLDFEVPGISTIVPGWIIEANRYLDSQRQYFESADEAFDTFQGRENYKQSFMRDMAHRIGENAVYAICGICSRDLISWRDAVELPFLRSRPFNNSAMTAFQGIREVVGTDTRGAISIKDPGLTVDIQSLVTSLKVERGVMNYLLHEREAIVESGVFRYVEGPNRKPVTLYPYRLRFYSGDPIRQY